MQQKELSWRVLLVERKQEGKEAERVGGRQTGRDGERKEQREMGGGQGPFRREHSVHRRCS